jgi:hypothetical protein
MLIRLIQEIQRIVIASKIKTNEIKKLKSPWVEKTINSLVAKRAGKSPAEKQVGW